MSNIIVIYKSKYGSTKRYAQWIAEDTGADLREVSEIKTEDLERYETIVFGGSLHAVGIKGIKIITDNFDKLNNKKIVVYGVGASPVKEEPIKAVVEANFKGEMRNKIKFFYLRGAFNYEKLSVGDKMLMNALKLKIKSKKEEELDEDSKGLLECYDHPADWTDRKDIDPLVEYIKRTN